MNEQIYQACLLAAEKLTKEEIKQEINKEDQIHRMVENHRIWESRELVNCFRL